MKNIKKLLAVLLCVMLTATVTCCVAEPAEEIELITLVDGETYGEGETAFTLNVIDPDGNELNVTINTDAATVGEALYELGIIDGDETEYGLYVTIVNNITVDYNVSGQYWAFYIDGEYAMTGVDSTEVTAGSVYSFIVE